MKRVALLLSVLALAGCGGESKPAAPEAVAQGDLRKDGTFWNTLTPDLKDELVTLCLQKTADARAASSGDPSVASRIKSIPTDELVSYIDKQYTNASKRESLITINCTLGIGENISQAFDEAAGELSGP